MNLMPITVTKSINSPASSGGNALSGNGNAEQASEFTGILSDSLIQQNSPTATTEIPAQTLVQLPLPTVSGQELPQTGESLPPSPALVGSQGIITEDELLASIASTLEVESAQDPANSAAVILAADEDTMALSSELLTGITLVRSDNNPLTMATAAAANPEGVTVQANSLTRQTTAGMAFSPQSAIPFTTMNSSAQTSTGENSLTGQAQAMPMAEVTAASTTDDKLDFSRIIEKGLSQLNKESLTSQVVPTTEASSKSNLESVKTVTDSLQLQQSIDKPKWSQEFGSRLVWLAKEGVQSAQLKLTPAHLGTIEVKISIQNDQANVSFLSQNGVVRDAIESSLPRLREMMQDAGVKLEQANVSTNSNANAQQHSAQSDKTPVQESHANSIATEDEEDLLASSSESVVHEGVLPGIDFYA